MEMGDIALIPRSPQSLTTRPNASYGWTVVIAPSAIASH